MAFRFEKLTIKAQEAVQRAQELAADRGNPQIEPLHLLAACWRRPMASSRRSWKRSAPIARSSNGIVASELQRSQGQSADRRRNRRNELAECSRRPARSRRHEGRVRLHRTSAAGA